MKTDLYLVAHIREYCAISVLRLDELLTELQTEAEANYSAALKSSLWKRILHLKIGQTIDQSAANLKPVDRVKWLPADIRPEFVSLHAYRARLETRYLNLLRTPGHHVMRLPKVDFDALKIYSDWLPEAWDQVLENDVTDVHGDLPERLKGN